VSKDSAIVYDKGGFPLLIKSDVLLAATDAPPAPASDPVEETPPLERSVKPEDVGWDEWQRRHNAVSTLAREYDEVDQGDIREFLKDRTSRDLSEEEISQLHHDIRTHRVGDITDVLDGQLRSTVDQMKRARRTVRVSAPKGWLKRAFNNLDQRGVEQVVARLTSRGHDADIIKKRVLSRVSDQETRKAIVEKLDSGNLKVEG
jgi:hypothetical protein